jgi:predicted ArsR family transcriptional regulator
MTRRLPYQRHSPTSAEAAVRAEPAAPSTRARILDLIRQRGPLSDEAVADILHLNPSTARPRRIELQRDGLIQESSRQGRTRAGRTCTLWEATDGQMTLTLGGNRDL